MANLNCLQHAAGFYCSAVYFAQHRSIPSQESMHKYKNLYALADAMLSARANGVWLSALTYAKHTQWEAKTAASFPIYRQYFQTYAQTHTHA